MESGITKCAFLAHNETETEETSIAKISNPQINNNEIREVEINSGYKYVRRMV
jgi:hypothetical protein